MIFDPPRSSTAVPLTEPGLAFAISQPNDPACECVISTAEPMQTRSAVPAACASFSLSEFSIDVT